MSQSINKIGELKKLKSFIQINTIKGFKYVDKAGEILNSYCTNDNTVPQFKMDLHGLVIRKPTDKIEEIKISSNVIWCFFKEIDSFDSIQHIFTVESSNILKILGIEKVSRIGWRNHFVYEYKNSNEQEKFLNKFNISNKLHVYNLGFKIEDDEKKDFEANLFIQPVVKEDNKNQTYGLFFDIDVYIEKEFNINAIDTILKKYISYLRDNEGFINILNEILK